MTPADDRQIKDDLSLMQTAYAVALVLGFRNIIACLYSVIFTPGEPWRVVVRCVYCMILMLTIMRFFWAVGNIRRFIRRNEAALRVSRRYIISFHFGALLIHAFILCFLSQYTLDFSDSVPLDDGIRVITLGYISFLLFNAAWLWSLVRSQEKDRIPEMIWFRNNTICAGLALGMYALTAWHGSRLIAFISISPIFFLNSIYDLFRTSATYVWIERVSKAEITSVTETGSQGTKSRSEGSGAVSAGVDLVAGHSPTSTL